MSGRASGCYNYFVIHFFSEKSYGTFMTTLYPLCCEGLNRGLKAGGRLDATDQCKVAPRGGLTVADDQTKHRPLIGLFFNHELQHASLNQ